MTDGKGAGGTNWSTSAFHEKRKKFLYQVTKCPL